jgi:hypothetical protein
MTKDLFFKQTELRQWWVNVTAEDNWKTALVFARSAFLETRPTKEMLDGAAMFEGVLNTLGDLEEGGGDMLSNVSPANVPVETLDKPLKNLKK